LKPGAFKQLGWVPLLEFVSALENLHCGSGGDIRSTIIALLTHPGISPYDSAIALREIAFNQFAAQGIDRGIVWRPRIPEKSKRNGRKVRNVKSRHILPRFGAI
jgi:hypothetical protein